MFCLKFCHLNPHTFEDLDLDLERAKMLRIKMNCNIQYLKLWIKWFVFLHNFSHNKRLDEFHIVILFRVNMMINDPCY